MQKKKKSNIKVWKLTAQHRHSLVCYIEATVGHSLISHKHHCHVRTRGGQLWGEGGTTKPGTKGEETQKVLQKTGCLTSMKVNVFVLSYPQN